MRSIRTDRGIVPEPWRHVVDPLCRALIRVADLQRAVVVQLEVIVCVDEPGQHERTVEIHDNVAAAGPFANRQHSRREAERRRRRVRRDDARVDERHRLRLPEPNHDRLTA